MSSIGANMAGIVGSRGAIHSAMPAKTDHPRLAPSVRRTHEKWLLEITAIPTAAGCEQRVMRWVERWAARRPTIALSRDKAGNLFLTRAGAAKAKSDFAPLLVTAHLDHPAFVVTDVQGDLVRLEFRGGVNNPYFHDAMIDIIDARDRVHRALIESLDASAMPFKRVLAGLPRGRAKGLAPGDVGRWALPKPVVRGDFLHTHACDDLAAVAAALAFYDTIHDRPGFEHVGLLFTRAEEIGFVGAIAACRLGSVPKDARLICLENSRSFAESPIGAGPILRVGDRMSVFEPTLTNRLTDIFLDHAKKHPSWKWQRKLMPGGTCEATAFSSFGFQSTCICLPLGNYHNMRDIDGVNAGKRPARVGREFISVSDFHGLVDMLILVATQLDRANLKSLRQRMDDLLDEHRTIIGMK
jgi:putative aminopeptidase FrvX